MLFLGWLAVCFLVVGLINFYLRRFGLPKRRTPVSESKSTGYGSITFSGSGASIGGLFQAATFSRGGDGGSGESVHWINSILSWIYHTQTRIPDFVDSWLTALTTEAEHQAKELQIVFEGIHGSPPEFSNFRSEPSSSEKAFTILTTVTLKDVTLQTSVLGKSTATKATQPVKCDVYIQSLTGPVKTAAQLANNDLSLQFEFISEPAIKLQIRPTRVDYTVDNVAFEKIVRAALSKAPMRVDWTSRSTGRPSHLRIVEPNNSERSRVRRVAATNQLSPKPAEVSMHPSSVDGGFGRHEVSPTSSSSSSAFMTPSPSSLTQESQPFLTQQSDDFRGQQLPMTTGQHERQVRYSGTTQGQQQQGLSAIQGQQYSPPIQGQMHPNLTQGQSLQGTLGGQQLNIAQGQKISVSSEMFSQGPKLFIKVVKANGLVDTDFGECSAYCRVHVDTPPQDFTTNVIRNTVNPYWDEQFVSDFDRRTKQIEFEILDRDRQPSNNLLGKAVVLVDEIRRMPSSRQIIPLTGKPKSRTSTSGSVTVEFIFKDSMESTPSTSSSSNVGIPFGLGQGSGAPTAAGQKLSLSSPTQLSLSPRESLIRNDDKTRVGSTDYSLYGGRVGPGASQLSAHNLALTSSQPVGAKSLDSPTVVVTGVDSQRSATLQPSESTHRTLDASGRIIEGKKKQSFASTLKRTLERVKIKPRSQSADRSTSHSLREGNLLRPPDQGGAMGQSAQATTQQQTNRNAGSASDIAAAGVESDGTIRKGRSNSFSSSLRRIFRKDKKDTSSTNKPATTTTTTTTTSSSYTHLGRGEGASKEALNVPSQGIDRSRRQTTPVPSGDRFATGGGTDFPYSSSVPAPTSPLQSH